MAVSIVQGGFLYMLDACAHTIKKRGGGKNHLCKWYLCGPAWSRMLVQMTSGVLSILKFSMILNKKVRVKLLNSSSEEPRYR